MKKNVGEYDRRISRKPSTRALSFVLAKFSWTTSHGPKKRIYEIVNNIWQNFPISHRDFVDNCIFTILDNDDKTKLVWTILFVQEINPKLTIEIVELILNQ